MLEEIVRMLRRFYNDNGRTIEHEHGPEARTVAQEIGLLLEARLDENTYPALWDTFIDDPDNNEAELIGALEAMTEADRALYHRLSGLWRDFDRLARADRARMIDKPEAEEMLAEEEEGPYYRETYLYGNQRQGSGARPGPDPIEPTETRRPPPEDDDI